MTILVVAPHPDDETLGCGGTLLRAKSEGTSIHWAICSRMSTALGYTTARIRQRELEVDAVAEAYGFASVNVAPFHATTLDSVPLADFVGWIGGVVDGIKPSTLLLPHPGDAHSDHAAVFSAAAACSKIFRYPSVRTVLTYEVLSETDFGLNPALRPFRPTRFVDVSRFIDNKISILSMFAGEMAPPPFPRSELSVRALATLRGVVSGCEAAEAFEVLREII